MKELQDKSLGSSLELVGMRSVRKEEGWIWTRGVVLTRIVVFREDA